MVYKYQKSGKLIYDESFKTIRSEADLSKFDLPNEDELETLGTLSTKVGKNSRLACQIQLKDNHNNITLTIAPD